MQETHIKQEHLRTVLRAIQRYGGATKPELAASTGLAVSTVHHAVTQLEASGYVNTQGLAASRGGRCAARYTVNEGLGVVAAVGIRLQSLLIGVFDLAGNCLYESERPLSCASVGPEIYASEACQAVKEALCQANGPRCFGVGITVPGAVEGQSGVVLQLAGAPHWQRFPLANRFGELLHLPVWVEKDVFACALDLENRGCIHSRRCAAYLSIRDGVGAAVMANGQVLRGVHGLAGEIGHLTVRPDGAPCTCGNTGCLELYCSDAGIVRQYNAHDGARCTDVEDVMDRLKAGDETAARVFSQAMRYLVDVMAILIMSYDPEEIVITCRWLSQQRGLYARMLDALYQRSIFTQQHTVDVRLLEEEEHFILHASAWLVDVLHP